MKILIFILLGLLFYISEITTIITRSEVRQCIDPNQTPKQPLLYTQLFVNIFCFLVFLIITECRLILTRVEVLLPFVTLIILDCVASVDTQLVVQLFIDLFGYSFLILFWEIIELFLTNYPSRRLINNIFNVLHLFFIVSIIIESSRNFNFCRNKELFFYLSGSELILLGFIWSFVKHGYRCEFREISSR
jgi:hypothetical protein